MIKKVSKNHLEHSLDEKVRKWCGITGSWRHSNYHVRNDVKRIVKMILGRGDGIVTGGALGVDYYATDVVLEQGNPKYQLKVYLPTKVDDYLAHYGDCFDRPPEERVIDRQRAEELTNQLFEISRRFPEAIYDRSRFSKSHEKSYYDRNQKVVDASEELYAFHVDGSQGVQDTIDKAIVKGIPIHVYRYEIKKPNWADGVLHEEFNIPKEKMRGKKYSAFNRTRKKK